MEPNQHRAGARPVILLAALGLALAIGAANAQAPASESQPVPPKPPAESYQTVFLNNVGQQNDAFDLLTDLRNMIPRAKVFYIQSLGAISIHAPADDMPLAMKMIADLDRPQKAYRLAYTLTETEGGKQIGAQHFTLIAVSGAKTTLKQGSRVPTVTGNFDLAASNPNSQVNSQVQYLDVGLSIEASLDGIGEGLRLHSKVEQSTPAEEKSGLGAQDPVIRQTTLDTMSTLVQGRPLVLGSLDIPGGTRHLEIEVVSDPVK